MFYSNKSKLISNLILVILGILLLAYGQLAEISDDGQLIYRGACLILSIPFVIAVFKATRDQFRKTDEQNHSYVVREDFFGNVKVEKSNLGATLFKIAIVISMLAIAFLFAEIALAVLTVIRLVKVIYYAVKLKQESPKKISPKQQQKNTEKLLEERESTRRKVQSSTRAYLTDEEYNEIITSKRTTEFKLKWADGYTHSSRKLAIIPLEERNCVFLIASTDEWVGKIPADYWYEKYYPQAFIIKKDDNGYYIEHYTTYDDDLPNLFEGDPISQYLQYTDLYRDDDDIIKRLWDKNDTAPIIMHNDDGEEITCEKYLTFKLQPSYHDANENLNYYYFTVLYIPDSDVLIPFIITNDDRLIMVEDEELEDLVIREAKKQKNRLKI